MFAIFVWILFHQARILLAVNLLLLLIDWGDFEAPVTLGVAILILYGMTALGEGILRDRPRLAVLFSAVSGYLWIGYVLKLFWVVDSPDGSWVTRHYLGERLQAGQLEETLFSAFPGLIALQVGLLLGCVKAPKAVPAISWTYRHSLAVVVIVGLVLMRVVGQEFFDIGIPGVRAKDLGVPFLTGIYALVAESILFAAINVNVYASLIGGRRMWLLLALSLALVNVLIDLRVGSKDQLFLQGLLFAYFLWRTRVAVDPAARRWIGGGMALLLGLTVLFYQYINAYRFALLSGKQSGDAIEVVIEDSRQRMSFLSVFYDRINGLPEFHFGIQALEGRQYEPDDLLGNAFGMAVSRRIFGAEATRAVSAYGVTQFAAFYSVGGAGGLGMLSLILGYGFARIYRLFVERLAATDIVSVGIEFILVVLFLRVLFAAGNLVLYGKELLLLGVWVVLFSHYILRAGPADRAACVAIENCDRE